MLHGLPPGTKASVGDSGRCIPFGIQSARMPQLVVSVDVARHAALDLSRFPAHDLTVRNRAGQIAVRVIDRVAKLPDQDDRMRS